MSERDIFLAVIDLPDMATRSAYLDEACGDDAALRARVEALLRSHEDAGSFLGTPLVAPSDKNHPKTRTLAPDADMGHTHPHSVAVDVDVNTDDALVVLAPSCRPDSLGRIGHYEVLEVLGRGGFGIVYRAFDEVLQRVVAVKVLAPSMAATSPARKRFIREARSSAAVRHENVVQVYAVVEQPLPYLVMEFIPGETLQQRLDRTGPLEMLEVLRIGRQVAEGLAAAHETGLIHRDIKPSNVLIEGGPQRAKITDFGLARAADDASISQSGVVAGTPMYMAPEQAKGDSLDHRADLFSLGSVLYVMCTGRPPFRASGTLAVLKRVCEESPRPIREIIPEIPEWLCRVIEKLHAKNPAGRFQSAKEVADVMADCEKQLQAHREVKDFTRIPTGGPAPSPMPRPRKGVLFAATLVPIALIAGILMLGDKDAPINGIWIALLAGSLAVLIARFLYPVQHGSAAGHDGKPAAPPRIGRKLAVATLSFALFAGFAIGGLYLNKYWMAFISLRREAPGYEAEIVSGDGSHTYRVHGRVGKDIASSGLGFRPGSYTLVVYKVPDNGDRIRIYSEGLQLGAGEKRVIEFPILGTLEVVGEERGVTVSIDGGAEKQVILSDRRGSKTTDPQTSVYDAPKGSYTITAKKNGAVFDTQVVEVKVGVTTRVEIQKQSPSTGSDSGFVSIFNGKDLTGWSGKFPDAWSVEDGILIGRGKQGSLEGWSELIHTRNDFQNVHLRVVAKINAVGWASLRVRKQRGSYFGYKVWLSNDPDNTGARTGRFDVDGGEDNFQVTNPPDGLQLRADEWFTLDFIARGSELVTSINNKEVARTTDASFASGEIQLEVAGADTVVQFRRIEIKELSSGSPNADVVKALRALAAAKERQFEAVKADVVAGKARSVEATRAEIEVIEARIRVAEEEHVSATIIALLEQLLAKREEEKTQIEPLVTSGVEDPEALARVTVQITIARVRLKKAKSLSPPPLAVAPFDAIKAKEYQVVWAKHLSVEPEISNSIGMKFRLIPPGRSSAGSTPEAVEDVIMATDREAWAHNEIRGEMPGTTVRLDEPFFLGVHEVTREQFERFVAETRYVTEAEASGKGGLAWNEGTGRDELKREHTWRNATYAPSGKHPVVFVTSADAQAFCEWLGQKDGRHYTLLSEAQWEFACRAGTTTPWYCGTKPESLDAYEWIKTNSKDRSHAVGSKKPNPFGLFDMSGNVSEVVQDVAGNPVHRGGTTAFSPWLARSASRFRIGEASYSHARGGFRVAIVGDLKPMELPGTTQVDSMLKSFRELVSKKTQALRTLNEQFSAGKVSQEDVERAEDDLTEARIKLAEAEGDKPVLIWLMEELVKRREAAWRLIIWRIETKDERVWALVPAEVRLAKAKARLTKVVTPPSKSIAPEPRPKS